MCVQLGLDQIEESECGRNAMGILGLSGVTLPIGATGGEDNPAVLRCFIIGGVMEDGISCSQLLFGWDVGRELIPKGEVRFVSQEGVNEREERGGR